MEFNLSHCSETTSCPLILLLYLFSMIVCVSDSSDSYGSYESIKDYRTWCDRVLGLGTLNRMFFFCLFFYVNMSDVSPGIFLFFGICILLVHCNMG